MYTVVGGILGLLIVSFLGQMAIGSSDMTKVFTVFLMLCCGGFLWGATTAEKNKKRIDEEAEKERWKPAKIEKINEAVVDVSFDELPEPQNRVARDLYKWEMTKPKDLYPFENEGPADSLHMFNKYGSDETRALQAWSNRTSSPEQIKNAIIDLVNQYDQRPGDGTFTFEEACAEHLSSFFEMVRAKDDVLPIISARFEGIRIKRLNYSDERPTNAELLFHMINQSPLHRMHLRRKT